MGLHKMSAIKISQPEQYLHETLTWERALEYYKQENAFLKTRLSQVLDKNTTEDFVETAENFNNHFVFTDDYLASLLLDIRQQKDMLQKSVNGDHSNDKLVHKYQNKLRSEMDKFEQRMSTIKNEFNQLMVSFVEIN